MTGKTRAFRYATTDPSRVPTARILLNNLLPANELAGYPYQMPTALPLQALGPKGRFTLEEPLSNAYGITCES